MQAVLLCLATKKGFEVIKAVAAVGSPRHCCVCVFEERDVVEPYHQKIAAVADAAGLPTVGWGEFRRDPAAYLARHQIEAIILVGWRYLITEKTIEQLHGEVYVLHDSLLPKLRGFAPLASALIVGEAETGVTLLRVGRDVDDGPILWQERIPIGPRDKIADLIDRVSPLYVEGVLRYLRGELTDTHPQNEMAATYSLWRDHDDYRLDWKQDAERIERTVRALGIPYLGACTALDGRFPIKIHEAEMVQDRTYVIRDVGKIAQLDDQGRPTVVCGKGQLKILEATSDGRAILPLNKLRQRFS